MRAAAEGAWRWGELQKRLTCAPPQLSHFNNGQMHEVQHSTLQDCASAAFNAAGPVASAASLRAAAKPVPQHRLSHLGHTLTPCMKSGTVPAGLCTCSFQCSSRRPEIALWSQHGTKPCSQYACAMHAARRRPRHMMLGQPAGTL